MSDFDKAFEVFMDKVQAVFDKYWNEMGFTHTKPEFEVTEGPRYIKVIRDDRSQRSVHLFVDKRNGDVLKAASWKAPAKGARSNIFDEDNGESGLTAYGAKYK